MSQSSKLADVKDVKHGEPLSTVEVFHRSLESSIFTDTDISSALCNRCRNMVLTSQVVLRRAKFGQNFMKTQNPPGE